MKKFLIAFMMCILFSGFVFAEEAETPTVELEPFVPISPRVMAQGGSFVAVAEGYESLFYNPAGFAMTNFSLTVPSVSTWAYMNPATIDDFTAALPPEGQDPTDEQVSDLLDVINRQVGTGGIGFGASTGVGLVADGLGLGMSMVLDSYLEGDNAPDASGDVVATIGGVAGYAITLELAGMGLNIGADLRPMYRIHSIVENRDALQMVSELAKGNPDRVMEIISNTTALTGWGVGIDIGGILEIGPLQVGLSVRDLFGTKFKYYANTMSEVLDYMAQTGSVPEIEENLVTDVNYVIPMEISAGVAFNLDVLKPLLDLTVHGDIQDVVGVIKDKRSPWTLLHIGAEAKLFNFAKVRAGFNQGYITMGAGVHLLFMDVNAAFFTREKGKFIGDQPNSGAVVEVAIRL